MKITQAEWERHTTPVQFNDKELMYEKNLREYYEYRNEQIRNRQDFVSYATWSKM